MSENSQEPNIFSVMHGVAQLASLLYAYYSALCNAGFTDNQAFTLTVEYQGFILGHTTGTVKDDATG